MKDERGKLDGFPLSSFISAFHVLYLWQGWKLGAPVYLAIAAAVTLLAAGLLLRWLKTNGARRFAAL